MTKFTKLQAKARAAFAKGVNGVSGAMNKVAHITNTIPREISSGDASTVVGMANTVSDARTALTGMSIGSG